MSAEKKFNKSDKTAFIFPGQGSQCIGMGKDFYDNFKECKLTLEEASDHSGINLKKLCFEGHIDELTLTENLQPALFAIEASILKTIHTLYDVKPIVVAGHSLGEYSALMEAQSISVASGSKLTRARGLAMQTAVPPGKGSMLAVLGLAPELIANLCKKVTSELSSEVLEPANYNSVGQVVLAGSINGISVAENLIKSDPTFKGGKAITLQVSAPFHCSMMRPAQKAMTPLIQNTKFSKPICKIIPNVTAHPTDDHERIAQLLIDQITSPVQWVNSVLEIEKMGVDYCIEIGPGKVLAGLQKRITKNLPCYGISTVEQMRAFYEPV